MNHVASLAGVRATTDPPPFRSAPAANLRISLHHDLHSLEGLWTGFEKVASCTAFQSYAWLSSWQDKIGLRTQSKPVIVLGLDQAGEVLFLFPLAIERQGYVRRLTWLGGELCDYNLPLLNPRFRGRVDDAAFRDIWATVGDLMRRDGELAHDIVDLKKMPVKLGSQPNPLLALGAALHPSGAHSARLGDSWEAFYEAKRTPSTRRRDRTKRKRLASHGEVRFVEPHERAEIIHTLDTLFIQKGRAFAKMGVANPFDRPGRKEFYIDVATRPDAAHLVHVSRLDVGNTLAAVNFGLVFRTRYYHVLASYDDGEVSRFGPGMAHLHHLMGRAIERGCEVFDFTVGDERYKLDWCDTDLPLYDHVSAASLRGAPFAALSAANRGLRRAIKQNPLLWRLATKARAAIGSRRGAAEEPLDDQ